MLPKMSVTSSVYTVEQDRGQDDDDDDDDDILPEVPVILSMTALKDEVEVRTIIMTICYRR